MGMLVWHICDRYCMKSVLFTQKHAGLDCGASLVQCLSKYCALNIAEHQTMLDNIISMGIMMLVKLFSLYSLADNK